MTVPELGTLEPVPIRDVWQHEANDWTPWLAEHVDLLAEALGMEDLEVEGTEVPVGGYKADLVCSAGESTLVVENKFASTDHDHIGKLVTYAAGLDASHAVLVAEEFRPEHRSALNWLNRVSTQECSFFGLVLEAWRIGGSPPAPRFRVAVQPDDWSRAVRMASAAHVSERNALYLNFWTSVMEDLHQVDEIWRRKRTPQPRVLDELPQRLLQSRCGIRRCLRSPQRQPVPPRGGISTPGSRHRPSTACSTRDAARSKPLSE